MQKIFKMVGIAMALVIVLAISIASVAMAAGPHNSGTCPNPDCPNNPGTCPNPDCPNPDCTGDGSQLQNQYQNRAQDAGGSAYLYQHRFCQER